MIARLDVVPFDARHWPQVERIYREGIATGRASFESEPPTLSAFVASRLEGHTRVALRDGAVIGWVAASPVSSREVYRGVVEHSVYVAASARGVGVGARLLEALIESTESVGIWMIQSSVFVDNTASLELHRRHGFREVGVRERIARMTYGARAGEWLDTVLIERRSPIVGGET